MTDRHNQPSADNASLGELTAQLGEQLGRLVRDEMRLAQVELQEKGRRAGTGAGLFGAAGAMAFLGLGCLVATAILALDLRLSAWLAALIVGGALLILAGLTAIIGRGQLRQATPALPTRAVQSTKQDIQALKGHKR